MERKIQIKEWWRKKRLRYNIALVIAGFGGFVAYCIVGSLLVPGFEATLFTTVFQGFLYFIMMGFANLFYTFCMYIDVAVSGNQIDRLSHKVIYYGYFSVSCFLPFSIAILLIVFYWIL